MDNFVADAIFVDASPQRVFAALLDPQDVLVWMDADDARIAATEGGEFAVRRRDGSTVRGTVSRLLPGERVEIDDYHWQSGDESRGPMRLSFALEPRDYGVWLVARQEGLDSGKDWQTFARDARQELIRATVALKRHIEQI